MVYHLIFFFYNKGKQIESVGRIQVMTYNRGIKPEFLILGSRFGCGTHSLIMNLHR